VVTPINTAVALNYACDDCVTQALAVQLVATLAQPPSAETMNELSRLWAQLEARSEIFELLPLEQVYAELLTARAAILEIVGRDGAVATETGLAADVTTTPPTEEQTTTTPEPSAPPEETTTTTPTETSAPEETGTTTEETPTTTEETPATTTTTP
jgi:putative peptide zinc metalloprotease protein